MNGEKDEDVLSVLEEEEEIGGEDESDEVLDVFSCKYCDFQSTDIDELDEHIVHHDEAILEDNHKEETDSTEPATGLTEEVTLQPLISIHKNQVNCDKEFSIKTNHTKRMKQSIPAYYDEFKNKIDKRVFVCPHCGYQTMRKLDINKHLKVHSEPVEVPIYACGECTYTTRRKCDMPKHLLTHCKDGSVTMYQCNHCQYATKRKGDLPKHMLCHKKPDLDSLYRCHQCTYSTRRRGDLKKHLMSHESDFVTRENSQFNCTECGYISKRLNDLHKHVVLHCDKAVKGIFKCQKCDYATEVGSDFAKHVLSNCRIADMGVAIFPKDTETMQDYIVLEEDELHLYQLDKESFTSMDVSAKEAHGLKRNKRKRIKDSSYVSSEQYYVEDEEGLEESELLEKVEKQGRGNKVLVLAGYEGDEKAD